MERGKYSGKKRFSFKWKYTFIFTHIILLMANQSLNVADVLIGG